MNTLSSQFSNPVPVGGKVKDPEYLSRLSVEEAANKEARLRKFYRDPNRDGSDRWFLAEFTFDLLRDFKHEGNKRKDRITENIMHEIAPCLNMKGYYIGNILPAEITYQNILGNRYELPEEQRRIELIFALTHIHDLDEDFADFSTGHLVDYLHRRIVNCDDLTARQKDQYFKMVHPLKLGLITISQSRRSYDADGKTVIKTPMFDDDPHKCFDAQENFWFAGGAKGPDRLWGTVQRFSHLPNQFPIDSHIDYAIDTRRMFMHRQFLETLAARYPQLSVFLGIINSQLRIAYGSFDTLVMHHPENPRKPKKGKYNPSTARLDLASFMKDAFKGAEFIDRDAQVFSELLERSSAEARNFPTLLPIHKQMNDQIGPYLAELVNPTGRLIPGLAVQDYNGPE